MAVPPAKSTPISQLPYGSMPPPPVQQQPAQPPPPAYINDQHRQLVAQAHQAAQVYTMPQTSTQDIAPDDDATINDVLGCLQAPGGAVAMPPPPHDPAMYEQMARAYGLPGAPPLVVAPQGAPARGAGGGGAAAVIASLLPFGLEDLRAVLVAVVLFVAASLLPLGPVVARFSCISGVPYGELLLRAAVFGVALLVSRRTLW